VGGGEVCVCVCVSLVFILYIFFVSYFRHRKYILPDGKRKLGKCIVHNVYRMLLVSVRVCEYERERAEWVILSALLCLFALELNSVNM
jgi:hypothetical protein